MLDKQPETNDLLGLVKDISALWHELGSKLCVPLNYRKTLRNDRTLSDNDRLEYVLNNWIGNETKEVKWKVIVDALKALERKDLVKNVIMYLEKPETYRKYISMRDFFPCPI